MNKKIKWRCPANIALVKYWGKKPVQLPCNPSLSMTLSESYTDLELILKEKHHTEIELDYYFENQLNDTFKERILKYLEQNQAFFPFIRDYALEIHSSNSFPYSAGIASSASAFGALSLALLSVEDDVEGKDFMRKASKLARLGSGSACRSIFAPFSLWGRTDSIDNSSDEYAVPVENVHNSLITLKDAILIVDDAPKKVSSSKGHALMKGHYFAESRFKQANEHIKELVEVMKIGNFERFIQIVEQEALTLHAMMMTSEEYYLLMRPRTVEIIEKVIDKRNEKGLKMCFTLDAGANVHLLYNQGDSADVEEFVGQELKDIVKRVIFDHSGKHPERLGNN